ncbi:MULTISPECIES: ABC transporter permease [unclassified Brevundimonas]|uniref:ABC transporter permease n=1 Tax=unclassified Brevundimonas TaxID=2622653 RepID=UPI0025C15AB6|nr:MULTISPECIES: ABC transporter permease [unclassified Brevundimonas]
MTTGPQVFATHLRAEVRRLLTRRWDAVVAFALPLLILVAVATMLGPGVAKNIPVAVVDQADTAFTRAAIREMQSSAVVDVAYRPASLDEAMALMRRGEIYSVAHFPSEMKHGLFRHHTTVSVYFNGAFQTMGSMAAMQQSAAIGVAAAPRLEERARQMGLPATQLTAPAVQVSIIGNPQLSFELFLGALLATGMLHLLAACSALMAVGRLLFRRSFHRTRLSSQGHLFAALTGRLLPHWMIFTAWGTAWIVWLAGFRGWDVAGSMPMLLLGLAAMMAVTVSVSAMLVAALADIDLSLSVTAVYSGAAIAFSNATLPLDHGPKFAQVWSQILPFTHYIQLQTAQWVTGADVRSSMFELALLCAMAVAALAVAWLAMKARSRRPATSAPLTYDLPANSVSGAFAATFAKLPKARPVSSLLLLAVVLYGFYYPAAYSGQVAKGLPVAVVSTGTTPFALNLVSHLRSSEGLDVATVTGSAKEAEQLMKDGVVDGVIILPENLGRSLAQGVPDGIAVWLNGGYLVRVASVGKAAAGAAAATFESQLDGLPELARVAKLAPTVRQESLFNPTQGYGDYAVPAVVLVILQQTLLMGAGVLIAIRRESMARPLALAGRLGLWLALIVIGTLSSLFYFGFIFWIQDYPRAGDLWGILLLSPVLAAASSALGLCFGTLFNRRERVVQVWVGTSALLFFLGGAAWPHFMMPKLLVWVAHVFPSTAAVQGFVRMNAMGASLQEVAPQALVLVLLAVVYGALWLTFGERRTA